MFSEPNISNITYFYTPTALFLPGPPITLLRRQGRIGIFAAFPAPPRPIPTPR